jgi:hypothetical protein
MHDPLFLLHYVCCSNEPIKCSRPSTHNDAKWAADFAHWRHPGLSAGCWNLVTSRQVCASLVPLISQSRFLGSGHSPHHEHKILRGRRITGKYRRRSCCDPADDDMPVSCTTLMIGGPGGSLPLRIDGATRRHRWLISSGNRFQPLCGPKDP